MRRKNVFAFLLTILLGLTLVGCGQPSAAQVIKQLQSVQSSLTSYRSAAFMTVHIQDAVQRYYVETWYQAPNTYRIALGNENKEISQIVLHNAQGTYILSPGAKKVIRFQGDWAEKQGNLYLYPALLSKIVAAANPEYSSKDKIVSFEVSADPLNPMINTQRISLEATSFAPKQVILYDKDKHPVITIEYVQFEKGVTFSPNAFSPDQTQTLQSIEMPVSNFEQGFGVVEPSWVPGDDAVLDETEQNGVIFVRYDGQEPFTIAEVRPQGGDIALGQGSLVNLYGIPAVMTGQEGLHQLYWINRGVEFQLTSKMPVGDLVQVASSTVDETGK